MIKEWLLQAGPDPEKVLDREGDWTLEKMGEYVAENGFSTSNTRYISLIKHECYPDNISMPSGDVVYQVVCYPDDTPKCWRCHVTIPDKMVVLWKFQNWDKIQHRRGA
jgi:hypothetical protein